MKPITVIVSHNDVIFNMNESYVRYAQIMGMVHLDTVRLPKATHSDRLKVFSFGSTSQIFLF